MAPTQAAGRLLNRSTNYICTSCLLNPSRQRLYSTKLSQPPSSAYALLPSRRLISLSGPDSTHYLQGVITANLTPSIPRTSGFYAAFLNAQGRVLNDVFIYPEKDGWLIEVDAKEAERLAKHIKRYKLRAKFDVRLLDMEERGVWSLWRGNGWTAHSLSQGTERSVSNGQVRCEDTRAPGMGRRVILPAGKKPEEEIEEVDEGVYKVRRYLKGVPEGQDELIRESALPQESNIDFMGGIDYRKGCYVGQELTIRTHHTGVVRKRILPVMLYGPTEPIPETLEYKPGVELGVESIPAETSIGRWEKRGRSAGKWLAGAGNIGLGLGRLEIMTGTMIQGEPGGYREGDEFKLEWQLEGNEPSLVKIKAFIPPWHLTKQ